MFEVQIIIRIVINVVGYLQSVDMQLITAGCKTCNEPIIPLRNPTLLMKLTVKTHRLPVSFDGYVT